jgi:8-oxo-dGTP pyrophosphatase MutT (NUDIX family)
MKKNGPWTIVDSKQAYKNPWLEVREDKVIRPDGKPGVHAVITTTPGASILPLDDKGYVYLAEEFRYAYEKLSIETPGGGSDANEDILETAKRELREEMGIIAKKWTPLGFVDPNTSIMDSRAHLFLAQELTFVKPENEGTEIIRIIKVKFEEAVKMALDNRITLAESVACILRAKEHLRK